MEKFEKEPLSGGWESEHFPELWEAGLTSYPWEMEQQPLYHASDTSFRTENPSAKPDHLNGLSGQFSDTGRLSDNDRLSPESAYTDIPAPMENAPSGEKTSGHRSSGRRVRRKSHAFHWSGLVAFLLGVAAAGMLAAGARLWNRVTYYHPSDRFSRDYQEDYADEWGRAMGISIPTWPTGQGVAFHVLREHGEERPAQEIYRLVNPAVVTVLVDLGDETAAVGTGVIFSPDGYFITNYHVVEGGTECIALLDTGKSCTALYVAGDEEHDLAVLKMDSAEPVPSAEFGDSDLLTVGDKVYAIGNPLGVEFRGTLTDGIVSAINRNVQVDGRVMTLIQTNAALNSGNSGGPLINEYGQVVGINVVKMSSTRSTVEGLGFAIPSASMDRLINDLLSYGKSRPEPLLGIVVNVIGEELEDGLWGIEVQSVTPDSPAGKAGIAEGDYIISAGGMEIITSQDLLRVRRQYYMGDSLPVTLWRNGERIEVTLFFPEE